VEGARPRGRPKKTWTEIVGKDCQACKLNREDAVDYSKWRKQIGSGSGWPDMWPFLGSGSGQMVPNTGYLNRMVLGPFRQLVHPVNRRHVVKHIVCL